MSDQPLLANERIDQLYGQNIQIIQSADVFSFSLDAVLLANFVPQLPRAQTLTDLCAGNGAVSLFLHQKFAGRVQQIEIQPRLADMARRSIALNHLQNRYFVQTIDLANVFSVIPKDSQDVVVCNPPYFVNNSASKKNPNCYLAIARHEIKTNLGMVIDTISGLLKMNGHAYLVHRPERLAEIMTLMNKCRLAPKKIQFVHPHEHDEANMVLIEAIKDGRPGGIKALSPVIVHTQDNAYSDFMKEILYGQD